PGAVMLAPEPSFVMYSMNALYAGMRFVGVPLSADFSLDLPAVRAAIEREQPSLVFIAYPNNPTGNLFAASDVDAILRVAPVLVRVADAKAMFDGLKARRILVKNVHGWHPLLANCLRITVGTPEENDLLLAACTELCR